MQWFASFMEPNIKIGVVRNYVLRTPVPPKLCTRTLKTIHPVPLVRNHVLCTLETMHFDQKFDPKKWNNKVED